MDSEQPLRSDAINRLTDLITYPREEMSIEIKGWLKLSVGKECNHEHDAVLAKALLAMANHDGGYIIIGLIKSGTSYIPDPARPGKLDHYSHDKINAIVAKYAEPLFHCDLQFVPHPESGDEFPIITVPGVLSTPVRCRADSVTDPKTLKQHQYYIRKPGPKSEVITTAREWDELLARCMRGKSDELLNAIRRILDGLPATSLPVPVSTDAALEFETRALERFSERCSTREATDINSRYGQGYWYFTLACSRALHLKRPEVLEILRNTITYTGWPPWNIFNKEELRPLPFSNDVMECMLEKTHDRSPAFSDFWWVSSKGALFTLRGYEDDGQSRMGSDSTRTLEPVIQIWRIGECLLRAAFVIQTMTSGATEVQVRCGWTGVKHRFLRNWTDLMETYGWNQAPCSMEIITPETITTSVQAILDDCAPIISEALRPLFDCFGFYQMPETVIRAELSRMQERR